MTFVKLDHDERRYKGRKEGTGQILDKLGKECGGARKDDTTLEKPDMADGGVVE